jgi:hypothetical protein
MTKLTVSNKRRIFPVSITLDMVRAAKMHSKKIPGCPRPNEGSVSWYVWTAVIEKLKRDGCDLAKIDSTYKSTN